MASWYMLTLVGADRPGIVAQVTEALFQVGASLGETSMLRLGANFTIMMMVSSEGGASSLQTALDPVAQWLGLRFHIDPIAGELHRHQVPNLQLRVYGTDRPGIVAQVTGILAQHGCNILELESDVVGSTEAPVYLMNIQGCADTSLEEIEAALRPLSQNAIEVHVSPIETLIG
jgi:glycine cleavage system transcriptional repressor